MLLVCKGTNQTFSGSTNDYNYLKMVFSDCVHVIGNIEINNFNPGNAEKNLTPEQLEAKYDFSFLDQIKEVSGYVLIHSTQLRHVNFKSLEIIRGQDSLMANIYSLYIEENPQLEILDFSNLREITNGSVLIGNNPKLCHMNEVIWDDLLNGNANKIIHSNRDPDKCKVCATTCEPKDGQVGCWFPGGCQHLSKVICHWSCRDSRCFGTNKNECCNNQCSGGCHGSTSQQCLACKSLKLLSTNECVEKCPKVKHQDPHTGKMTHNPFGTYQHFKSCFPKCPANNYVFDDSCVHMCPEGTYPAKEIEILPDQTEIEPQVCKPCDNSETSQAICPKVCNLGESELTIDKLESMRGCEVLNSNLIIKERRQSNYQSSQFNDENFQVLKTLRVINGYVHFQLDDVTSMSFLSNLEKIRPLMPLMGYSLLLNMPKLKTLGLTKLRHIENGNITIKADSLCLYDTIDWQAITKRPDSLRIKNQDKDGCRAYACDSMCIGCWATGPRSCQFCNTYKKEDMCVERCDGYVTHYKNYKVCFACHKLCKSGCSGPTEYDCTYWNTNKIIFLLIICTILIVIIVALLILYARLKKKKLRNFNDTQLEICNESQIELTASEQSDEESENRERSRPASHSILCSTRSSTNANRKTHRNESNLNNTPLNSTHNYNRIVNSQSNDRLLSNRHRESNRNTNLNINPINRDRSRPASYSIGTNSRTRIDTPNATRSSTNANTKTHRNARNRNLNNTPLNNRHNNRSRSNRHREDNINISSINSDENDQTDRLISNQSNSNTLSSTSTILQSRNALPRSITLQNDILDGHPPPSYDEFMESVNQLNQSNTINSNNIVILSQGV